MTSRKKNNKTIKNGENKKYIIIKLLPDMREGTI